MKITRYLRTGLEDILFNHRLRVSKFSDFNDPFEFQYRHICQTTDEVVDGDIEKKLDDPDFIEGLSRTDKFSGMSPRDIKRWIRKNKADCILDVKAGRVDSNRQAMKSVNQYTDPNLRILSFSDPIQTSQNEILLWSHYANRYSGFRIWIDSSLDNTSYLSLPERIVYKNNMPAVVDSDANWERQQSEAYEESWTTKAKCWAYENEIRVFILAWKTGIIDGNQSDYIDILPLSITRVDFGVKFPQRNRDDILKRFRAGDAVEIEFFQGIPSYEQYAIKYEQI